MNLYLLSQTGHVGYDENEGFVVAAADEATARAGIFAGRNCQTECCHVNTRDPHQSCIWLDPALTSCALIGTAADGVVGVVLAAFCAG